MRRNITTATTKTVVEDPVVVRPAVRHPRRRVPAEPSRRRDLAAGDRLAVAATGEAGEVDAEEVVRLDDRGEGQRQTQRDQREVEAADPQRRDADDEPDGEADGAGDRQRGQERPAVVGDEDHRRVGADAEEDRVADGDLAGVAGDDVEAEDGDGKGDALGPADGEEVLSDVGDVEEAGEEQRASPAPASARWAVDPRWMTTGNRSYPFHPFRCRTGPAVGSRGR